MTPYIDLHTIKEDERIEAIGQTAYCEKHGDYPKIAFVVDLEGADGFEKADRYIGKLLAKFPELEVTMKAKGPTPGAVSVIVQRMKHGIDRTVATKTDQAAFRKELEEISLKGRACSKCGAAMYHTRLSGYRCPKGCQ